MTAPLVQEVYTPVPQRTQGQATFDDNADNFLASLPGVATSMNALGAYLDNLAVQVDSDAINAAASVVSAANSASASAVSATASAVSATASANSATSAAASATTATQQASLAVASVASGAKPYATYAAAISDIANISTNQIVDVITDETRGNQRSLYQDNGTTLVYLRATEQYISPVSYVTSDSVQNMITKLLVLTGVIPQTAPVLSADFSNKDY